MELWTALIIGFVGSFHCVGMCGPIAMAIPRKSAHLLPLTFNAVLYNGGRILTYAALGLLFGIVGTGITISGFQGTLSILLGVSIIAAVVFNRVFTKQASILTALLNTRITRWYQFMMRKDSKFALIGLGTINGLLPCAFVYSGLAAAVLTNSPAHSAAYMALFGLGTFPAMYFMYLSPNILSRDLRTMLRSWIPYFAFTLGLFLIVRGFLLFDLFVAGEFAERVSSFCIFPGTTME